MLAAAPYLINFEKESTTTTLLSLIACFHAIILIVLSFTHGALIKVKL